MTFQVRDMRQPVEARRGSMTSIAASRVASRVRGKVRLPYGHPFSDHLSDALTICPLPCVLPFLVRSGPNATGNPYVNGGCVRWTISVIPAVPMDTEYVAGTFGSSQYLQPEYHRCVAEQLNVQDQRNLSGVSAGLCVCCCAESLFRVVPASVFLDNFASDRTHMVRYLNLVSRSALTGECSFLVSSRLIP
jgi:hypothetical protein